MKRLLLLLGIVGIFIAIGLGGGIGKQIARKSSHTDIHSGIYYGMVEYSSKSTGETHLVFQKADSNKDFCHELNESYLGGIKTTCQDCVIKPASCISSLPSPYQDIFTDKPMVLPFVSAPNIRIVVFGVPLQQAISRCYEMAEVWRKGMNQDARCIVNR